MLNKKRALWLSGPVPPLGCMDYASVMKFWNASAERFQANSWDLSAVIDWAIKTLLNSITCDSASRIFLPKTETSPFDMEDLMPFSAVTPAGQAKIPLHRSFLLAPVWNNSDTADTLRHAAQSPEESLPEKVSIGIYIKEWNLAIVQKAVHEANAARFLGRGIALMDTYSLRDLAAVIRTDGTNWYVSETDGSESYCPVLEPRIAALYNLSLERYCPELVYTED